MIIRLQLERVATRIQAQSRRAVHLRRPVMQLIAARCTEPESGGRMIEAIVTNTLLAARAASSSEPHGAGAGHHDHRGNDGGWGILSPSRE